MKTLLGILWILAPLILIIAAGYTVGKTDKRFILHRIAIGTFALVGVGAFFKILHWTGADQVLMVSYIGIVLGGFLLIWTGLRNPTGKVLFFQLISGILIGLVVLDRLVPIYALASVVALLPYLLAAATGTIIFNQTYVHPAEKNMVTMYFIVSIAAVVAILFRSF